MCVPHRQAIHASHRIRTIMQKAIMQHTSISVIFTQKLSENRISKMNIQEGQHDKKWSR